MRSATRRAGGLMIVLALAGCSGEAADEQPPAETPASTPASTPSPGPAESWPGGPSGSPAPLTGSQRSGEELEAALAAIDEAESLNAQVIPDAELRALDQEAARRADGIVVTPEECNVYTESNPDAPTIDARRAAMTFAGEASLQPDTVSLSSLPSEELAVAQLEASRSQLNACSEFTMAVSGQEITVTVAELGVRTAADEDLALRTTARIPGTIQESVTVTGVVGSTVIDVLVGGSPEPSADVDRAGQLMDLVVAELRRR